ncbi:MAG: hypothetical protein A3I01_14835 [Betaproteobacteria bacterium RIFCSPLOWO2_02_FULL_65_24]|nr:MAG: hypothetical protein A3I01_14835 [Betaproteobacteria bacterium RIFCSPLOWO2_02_FULL_65_24]OGA95259.1 MAG: hypothetical protein A3G27_06110 [Betaproteobacteria bacterium RIFCSPLOWO2_12_FULL_66_14]
MTQDEDILMQILDEHGQVALDDLLAVSGLEREVLIELVEYGVFEPLGEGELNWRFPSRSLTLVRRAARLRAGFELDTPALALAMELLERMDELQRRVHELECQLLR